MFRNIVQNTMFKRFKILSLAALALVLSGVGACKRKELRWDAGGLVPLFNTSMGLEQIDPYFLRNTSSDSSFQLVYNQLVYSSKFLKVRTTDTSINTTFNLRRLKLSDKSISQRITLGQINPLFNLLDGQMASIPAQNQTNLTPVDIDASPFFETATLDSGFLDITIKNELPVRVATMSFELRNADDNSLVASDVFSNILPGATATKSIDLRNKTVRKSLKGVITQLSTDASSGNVLIDAKKGVELTLSVRNLRPRTAVAAFPNQNIVDQNEGLVLDMGGPQVKWFKVKAGKLRIKIISTIQENMTMFFNIPSATKDGSELKRTIKLTSPANGSNVIEEEIIDMSGYLIDFRGKNPDVKDTVNTFHQILTVSLDSSGRKVPVALRDSINIFYQIDELTPEYAIGYLGKSENRTGYGTTPFELFKGAFGNITLKDFKASVLIQNFLGAEGSITTHKLDGKNVFTNNKLDLNAAPLASEIVVPPASILLGNYANLQPSNTVIDLNTGNSNVKQFVENLPQLLGYDLTIKTCPNGNVNNYKDFVTDEGRVDVYLRVEVPASFTVGSLTLQDTQALNLKSVSQPERIKSAKLYLTIDNGFPFELTFTGTLLDKNYNVLDNIQLEKADKIAGAAVDAKGMATGFAQTRLIVSLPRDRAKRISEAQYILVRATIKGNGAQQKIYNSYKVKVGCNVGFEYEAGI